MVLLLGLSSCRRGPSEPQQAQPGPPTPPDLSQCTRIEIRYPPSLLERRFGGSRRQGVLDSAELAHVRSLDPIVVEDTDRIATLAAKVSTGWFYYNTSGGIPGVGTVANVACYRGREQVASFAVKQGLFVVVGGSTWFQYTGGRFNFLRTMTDLWPLVLRGDCAENLGYLMEYWSPRVAAAPKRPAEHEWSIWCDVTLHNVLLRSLGSTEYPSLFLLRFQCPAAGEGKCHYAANPNCGLDSPADTVFLFETKAGWNQHGGAELFTFDHHDPKGGCVLLNDGTVKFLRTREELQQLRWK